MSQEPDQSPDDARPANRPDADVTSDTRHGPRPVPEGHRPASGRRAPRRSPPHGDVSPDGTRPWPRPSRGARWLVWGGTALAAATLTVGTVLAARKIAGLLTDDDRPPRSGRQDAQPGKRPQRLGLMQEIEANTASLSQSVEDVVHAVSTAVAGFGSVAGKAGSILREFDGTADLLRGFMDRRSASSATADDTDPGEGPLRHDPMTDADDDHDPRLHRL